MFMCWAGTKMNKFHRLSSSDTKPFSKKYLLSNIWNTNCRVNYGCQWLWTL